MGDAAAGTMLRCNANVTPADAPYLIQVIPGCDAALEAVVAEYLRDGLVERIRIDGKQGVDWPRVLPDGIRQKNVAGGGQDILLPIPMRAPGAPYVVLSSGLAACDRGERPHARGTQMTRDRPHARQRGRHGAAQARIQPVAMAETT